MLQSLTVGTVVLRMKTRNVAHVKVMTMMKMAILMMIMLIMLTMMNVMININPG